MNFETKARPIRTANDLEAAITAGAQLEFTACGGSSDNSDHYDMRRFPKRGSGGWIVVSAVDARGLLERGKQGHMFRAYYPRRSLLSSLAFWRAA